MQNKIKSQTFVLFWLGLLTGALLILALFSANGADSVDMLGRLRRTTTTPTYVAPQVQYQVPAVQYQVPVYQPQQYVVPINGYDAPTQFNAGMQNAILKSGSLKSAPLTTSYDLPTQ